MILSGAFGAGLEDRRVGWCGGWRQKRASLLTPERQNELIPQTPGGWPLPALIADAGARVPALRPILYCQHPQREHTRAYARAINAFLA
jgi:hypothetical protein